MIVYAVVSPSVFDSEHFEQSGYRDQVALFFRGLQGNAVLLLDPTASLLDEIESTVGNLSIKYRQELEIRIAELRKSLREKRRCRMVVKLSATKCNTASNQTPLQRCSSVALAASADAVFLPEYEIAALGASGLVLPTARMAEYSRTEFEERRRYFMEDLPPIDQLAPEAFDDLIVRATRFSVWIRVYDKQIGKGSNVSNFRRGLERILDLWLANAHFHPQRVEIITAESEHLDEGESGYVAEQKQNRIRECNTRVRTLLLSPLRSSVPLAITVSIKRDGNRIFHARHLQTQTAVVLMERGFDIQSDTGELRRNIVKVDLGAQTHLEECRGLAESKYV